ncbi:MAG: tryptophan synthase subunit alpha [Gammaproteobacteria bacterium]|nr:tryptophan synthase subunit alpha [Gammaproteobacteria bacterium]
MSESVGSKVISDAIRDSSGPAICAYITAGYPTLETFPDILTAVARSATVVEIGVPFTDPMADGLTIQRASHVALGNGVTLEWIFELLVDQQESLGAPHLLMGYYNPFLAFGLDRLAAAMIDSRTSGLIVPDLPLEEDAPIAKVLEPEGLALVKLVTPTTSPDRLARIATTSRGFVYVVTRTAVTGGKAELGVEEFAYLDRVRSAASLPVMAGFGVRSRSQVEALSGHVDGVIVGSALIDAIDRGEDPGAFLDGLRVVEVQA